MLLFQRLLTGFLLVGLPLSVVSAEIYKWVDEAGIVHFGDRVPDKYQQTVESLDVSVRQPSEAERQQAEAVAESIRQASDKARERRLEESDSLKASPEQLDQVSAQNTAAGKSPPNQLKPGQARLTRAQRMENYEAEMKRYKESQRCFAAYQMKGGGTRGYAFDQCETVKKPIHPSIR